MQKEKAFFREKTTNVETKSYRKIVVTNNTKSTIFFLQNTYYISCGHTTDFLPR